MKYQAENAVSSFFYYMWNAWSEEECRTVFKEMYPHFWEKWSLMTDKGVFGASERFYAELRTITGKNWWNGPSVSMTARPDASSLTIQEFGYAATAVLQRLRYRHGWTSTQMNITVTWTTTSGAPGARTMWRPAPDNPFLKRCRNGGSPTTPKPLNT